MIFHQFFRRNRDECTYIYAVTFKNRAYDVLKGIAETADYAHLIAVCIILFQASVYKCLKVPVNKPLDIRMGIMRYNEGTQTPEPARR